LRCRKGYWHKRKKVVANSPRQHAVPKAGIKSTNIIVCVQKKILRVFTAGTLGIAIIGGQYNDS
jgi:hypothetical protein